MLRRHLVGHGLHAFFFFLWLSATLLTRLVHQEHSQVVYSNAEARRAIADGHPALSQVLDKH